MAETIVINGGILHQERPEIIKKLITELAPPPGSPLPDMLKKSTATEQQLNAALEIVKLFKKENPEAFDKNSSKALNTFIQSLEKVRTDGISLKEAEQGYSVSSYRNRSIPVIESLTLSTPDSRLELKLPRDEGFNNNKQHDVMELGPSR